jgi:hypothetical protein
MASPGVTLVLACFTQQTRAQIESVGRAVRDTYPDTAAVLFCHVVNLEKVPRMLHGAARGIMENEYRKAAAELDLGLAPEDIVIILPDWSGEVCRSLGFSNLDRQAGIAVIDAAGRLVGTEQGEELVAAALRLLDAAGHYV